MANATWKRAEREIARLLGGVRSGPTGVAQADVVTPALVVEVKHRQRLPQWLLEAVAQARAVAPPGKLPVVVLHQQRQRYTESLVVMRLSDLQALLEKEPT